MKILRNCLVVFIIFLLLVNIVLFIIMRPLLGDEDSLFLIKQSRMEKILDMNYDDLLYVADYIMALDYDGYIWFYSDSNRYSVSYGDKTIKFDDKTAEAFHRLYDNNFSPIEKYGDKFVRFCRWSSMSKSCGLIYSVKGKPNIDIAGETSIRETQTENWYYFVNISDW